MSSVEPFRQTMSAKPKISWWMKTTNLLFRTFGWIFVAWEEKNDEHSDKGHCSDIKAIMLLMSMFVVVVLTMAAIGLFSPHDIAVASILIVSVYVSAGWVYYRISA